jgi:hypothetical protein
MTLNPLKSSYTVSWNRNGSRSGEYHLPQMILLPGWWELIVANCQLRWVTAEAKFGCTTDMAGALAKSAGVVLRPGIRFNGRNNYGVGWGWERWSSFKQLLLTAGGAANNLRQRLLTRGV